MTAPHDAPTASPGTDGERGLDASTQDLSPEDRRIVRRSLLLLGVLSTGSLAGAASSLYLVNEAPLLLIALSPIGRHLVLVAPIVNPVAFVAVGTLRRLLFYLPCFFLGRTLGPSGLAWIGRRAPGAERFFRWLEDIFNRGRYVAVVCLIGPAMSTIAGNSGMSLRVWLPLVFTGLVLRMGLTLLFGEWMREPIEWLLARIDEYKLPGTIGLVGAILAYQLWARRRKIQPL
jgi:membrane protein DedA with SNARE-associated domain